MSAYDVYGQKAAAYDGGFSADDALINFSQLGGGSETLPLLLQNMSLQYQQSISRLYDMTSNKVYLVRGRAAGRVGMGQVIGPRPISEAFMSRYGSVCNTGSNSLDLTMRTGCSDRGSAANFNYHGYVAQYCVIESLALQVQAEQMVINQNLDMSIMSLISSSQFSASGNTGNNINTGGGFPLAGEPIITNDNVG